MFKFRGNNADKVRHPTLRLIQFEACLLVTEFKILRLIILFFCVLLRFADIVVRMVMQSIRENFNGKYDVKL